ncbi:ABC transporter permease [Virgibacillus siamensis]|uniref:ABC transporter permease n=1 Tax=Virgibacillus siamensis TaxID=480071 RepID=UPI000985B0FA|nr:ABC transporter permease [Virgibacillus siamensis]
MIEAKSDYRLFKQQKNKQKRGKRIIFFQQLLILIAFFGLWELASEMQWINPLLFSSPSRIINLLIENGSDGLLWMHLRTTILATLAGITIGTISGTLIACILWSLRFSGLMNPYRTIIYAMPKVALSPIIIVALGPGYASIIAMGSIMTVPVTTFVVNAAFREIGPNYIRVLKSFGATRGQIFKEAVLPAALPTMISSLKVNVRLSLAGVIVGEFLMSKQGLGYLILYGFQTFDITLAMSSLLLLTLSAAVMYKIFEWIEQYLINPKHFM